TRAAPQETSRASQPLSGRADRCNSGFFIKHKRELTTLPVLRYSSRHKKGGLKILSLRALIRGGNMWVKTMWALVLAVFLVGLAHAQEGEGGGAARARTPSASPDAREFIGPPDQGVGGRAAPMSGARTGSRWRWS